MGRMQAKEQSYSSSHSSSSNAKAKRGAQPEWQDKVSDDKRDLDWATILKRTFDGYIRGERPNMYGEWIQW